MPYLQQLDDPSRNRILSIILTFHEQLVAPLLFTLKFALRTRSLYSHKAIFCTEYWGIIVNQLAIYCLRPPFSPLIYTLFY